MLVNPPTWKAAQEYLEAGILLYGDTGHVILLAPEIRRTRGEWPYGLECYWIRLEE